VSIGQWVVTGNIAGLEQVDRTTYVEATGQFRTEAGIRRFNVDSWKITAVTETYLSGSLHQDGEQTSLTADDGSGEYVIADAPADLPLNTPIADAYLAVQGFMRDGKLEWQTINYFPTGSGSGGGGGGGTGFYQLNLSGTPVPFPAPTAGIDIAQGTGDYTVREGDTLGSIASSFGISIDALMQANNLSDPMIYLDQKLVIPGLESQAQDPNIGRRFENLRGLFMETIYNGLDGGQRIEYSFIASTEDESFSFILVGEGLETLEPYHNRPVDISGVIEQVDQYGGMTFRVENFSVPFPDLKIELLEGTQQNTTVNGQRITLFTTTAGQQYVLLYPYGGLDDTTVAPNPPVMILEALAIPDETFEGYPALRTFSSTFADPPSGAPAEVTVTADQPYIVEEAPGMENYVPPSATIERVELVYYIPDPLYGNTDPANSTDARYIQPAWRFYGHYNNGNEFEFLVQALKQEFLLPELAPYRAPG
jgi:LysM repeat protein